MFGKFTKTYMLQLAEDAVTAAAGTAALVASADAAGILEWHWHILASMSGAAAVLSVLKSLAAKPFGDTNSTSVVEPAPAAPVVEPAPQVPAPADVPTVPAPVPVPPVA